MVCKYYMIHIIDAHISRIYLKILASGEIESLNI